MYNFRRVATNLHAEADSLLFESEYFYLKIDYRDIAFFFFFFRLLLDAVLTILYIVLNKNKNKNKKFTMKMLKTLAR